MLSIASTLRFGCTALLAGFLLLPGSLAAQESSFTPQQEDAIGELVREYILEHPEIILEAVERLQQREQQAASDARENAVVASQADLYEDAASPIAGNPEGDVTIVEFFDYNCPYCKKVTPEIFSLLARDGQIRYIAKEWPIFGDDSEFAARAALASDRQGLYARFHQALMAIRGPANPQTVRRAADEVGLDWDRLQLDMQDEAITEALARNDALARRLGIQGTPAMVIGEAFLPGAVPAVEIAAVIAEERARGVGQ
ncbi:MAG: DsbA family protein [Rhodospirillales bacterium]